MARELLYIASPLRGDVEQNIQNAMRYCEKAIRGGYIPLAPHVMYQGLFNDEIPKEREAALDIGLRMLEKCSRMWACGDRISEGMRGEMNLAKEKGIPVEEKPESFFMEASPQKGHTFQGLQQGVTLEMEQTSKTPDGILGLLKLGSQFGNYSVTNALAIRKQDSKAQFVATYRQWQKLGYRVKDYQHSIKVWTPIARSCFERDHKLVDVRNATPAEHAGILNGALLVSQHTAYRAGLVYDITQTNCPKQEYAQVTGNQYAQMGPELLYSSLQDFVTKHGFEIEESNAAATAITGGYCAGDKKIIISSRIHPAQKLAVLCRTYAQGLVQETSTQSLIVQDFEKGALSFLLASRLGVPDSITEQMVKAVPVDWMTTLPDSFEPSMGRIQKMLQYTEKGVQGELGELGLFVAPEQAAKKEQLTEQQREANRNFMQDIV